MVSAMHFFCFFFFTFVLLMALGKIFNKCLTMLNKKFKNFHAHNPRAANSVQMQRLLIVLFSMNEVLKRALIVRTNQGFSCRTPHSIIDLFLRKPCIHF